MWWQHVMSSRMSSAVYFLIYRSLSVSNQHLGYPKSCFSLIYLKVMICVKLLVRLIAGDDDGVVCVRIASRGAYLKVHLLANIKCKLQRKQKNKNTTNHTNNTKIPKNTETVAHIWKFTSKHQLQTAEKAERKKYKKIQEIIEKYKNTTKTESVAHILKFTF